MSMEEEKKISQLSDKEVLDLTRLTDADKAINSDWRSYVHALIGVLLFGVPAAVHIGYYLGKDEWLSWADGSTLLKYAAIAGYVALAVVFLVLMDRLTKAHEGRLDEVERHIEYKATAKAGSEAIWFGILAWGFGLWFPGFFKGLTAVLPLLILFQFYFTYFGTRIKLRHELNA